MHHGIKGQKWGVENGPPYPLDPQKDYSKAEQKANAKAIAKEYKHGVHPGAVNIGSGDISDIDTYVDNIVGKYGDTQINKFFTLRSAMKYDINRQIKDKQSAFVENEMQDDLKKNGFKKNDKYGKYEKELKLNNKENMTVSIYNFDTNDINGLKDTIKIISDQKSFNKIYEQAKDQITELAFSPDEKKYMSTYDDDDWNSLSEKEQKKIFRDKLGTYSFDWNDESLSANNATDVVSPYYLSFMIESGGFYGDHAMSFEYDMKNNKIGKWFSLDG
jgi:hypothetical protein